MTAALAFIFDLDGVIVDSMPVHTEAWKLYLQRYGIGSDSIESRMHGKRNDEIVRDLFGPHLPEDEVFRHGAAKEALYRELIGPRIAAHVVPGVTGFLAAHRGRPTGLASNAEPANVDFVLDTLALRPFFQVVVDGHQVERPKPHPDIYEEAARRLGFAPGNCIVFEDSATGITAAKAAGARVVAIQTTEAPLPAVDLTVSDFSRPELYQWLARQIPMN